MKPSIRKLDSTWVVTRPGYGFNPVPAVEEFPTWKAAVASLRHAPASAGASVERGHHTLVPVGIGGWPRHGTIRMEASWLGTWNHSRARKRWEAQ